MDAVNKEVAPFKPADVADKIRDRIQSSFVDLIPQEAWDGMIKGAIHEFTHKPAGDYHSNHQPKPSRLQGMINKEIEERFRASMKAELDKPEYQGLWTAQGSLPSEIATEIAKAAAPQLQAAFFGQMTQMLILQLKQALANEAQRGY